MSVKKEFEKFENYIRTLELKFFGGKLHQKALAPHTNQTPDHVWLPVDSEEGAPPGASGTSTGTSTQTGTGTGTSSIPTLLSTSTETSTHTSTGTVDGFVEPGHEQANASGQAGETPNVTTATS